MVGDRVVGHVDRRVGERLDYPGRVPGQFRPESNTAGAGPVLQPVDRPVKLVPDLGRDKCHLLKLGLHLLLPAGVAVLQEPLVMEDLHVDPAAAPADHLTVIKVVHRDGAVALQHQRRHIVPGLPNRLSAVLLKDLPAGELGAVDLLGERLHRRVVLVTDACPLDRVLCRDLAVAVDRDERNRLDGRVPPLLLQVAERDVIEGCVGGNAHDDPGPHIGVHKRCRKDGDLAAERVGDRLVDERGSRDLLGHQDLVVLQGELPCRLCA